MSGHSSSRDVPQYKLKAKKLSLNDSNATSSMAPSPSISRSMSEARLEVEGEQDEAKRARLEEFLIKKSQLLEFEELRDEDFQRIKFLGDGNGGSVFKVKHNPTGLVMARKMIHLDLKPEVRKQISRELRVLHRCSCRFIVGFYGSFLRDGEINILMEFMDAGSLDVVMGRVGRIPERYLTQITAMVLKGLTYLQDKLKVIHRDIKPSNILVNTSGDVKLCDFGVSGELQNSLAETFVGTKSYMAPERLMGEPYTVDSDIWSLGISLMELATGHFPIPPSNMELDPVSIRHPEREPAKTSNPSRERPVMAVFELLSYIAEGDPPRLNPKHGFSSEFQEFTSSCLRTVPSERMSLKRLSVHRWLKLYTVSQQEMVDYIKSTMYPSDLQQRMHELSITPSSSRSGSTSSPLTPRSPNMGLSPPPRRRGASSSSPSPDAHTTHVRSGHEGSSSSHQLQQASPHSHLHQQPASDGHPHGHKHNKR